MSKKKGKKGKKKPEIIADITKLMEEMKPLLKIAKISDSRIEKPFKKLDEMDFNGVRRLRKWLQEIYVGAYKDARIVRRDAPEAQWENYKLFQLTDLPEQKLWNAVARALSAAWGNKRERKKAARSE